MAGHVRFGARTGGALVILGTLVLFVGLFLGDSVATLFRLFPRSLLGVILLFGGLELASGVEAVNLPKEDRYVMLLTTGVSMWNMVEYGCRLLHGSYPLVCLPTEMATGLRVGALWFPLAAPPCPEGCHSFARSAMCLSTSAASWRSSCR
jgi:hypothetical protein